jgi:hypothetical protein
LHKEVDGIACFVPLRPTPIAVLNDETGEGGQNEIAPSLFEQLNAALLERKR